MTELFLISAGHVSQHGGSHEAAIVAPHVHNHRLPNYEHPGRTSRRSVYMTRDLRQTLIKEPFILVHR